MLFWLVSLVPRWGKQSGFMVLKKTNERWRWTCGKWWIKWRGRNHSMGRQVFRLICRVWHRGIRDIQVSGYMWYHGLISWTTSRYVLSSDFHIPCGEWNYWPSIAWCRYRKVLPTSWKRACCWARFPIPSLLASRTSYTASRLFVLYLRYAHGKNTCQG